MLSMLYAQVIVAKRTNVEQLSYAVPAKIVPYIRLGSLVTVPLRRSNVRAVVVGLKRNVPPALRNRIRDVLAVEQASSIGSKAVEVIERLADYYGASVAEVAFHALQGDLVASQSQQGETKPSRPIILQAPWAIRSQQYVGLIQQRLKSSGQVLLLFAQHSYLEAWQRIMIEQKLSSNNIFAGTIKDAFRPLCPNSLIIIDQPYHIGSKSPRRPFMASRTIGKFRAQIEGHQLLFGTELAHPTDLAEVSSKRIRMKVSLPSSRPFFITKTAPKEIIHPSLQTELAACFSAGQKVVIYAASRGWASALYCPDCQQVCLCQNCQRPLTLRNEQQSLCGYCNRIQARPTACPNCKAKNLVVLGKGVTRITSELKKLFPKTEIAELSGTEPWPKTAQCVVATEKIFSFPDFSAAVAAVIDVDRLLSGSQLNDSWTLLSQLIELQSRVERMLVQTIFPDHPVWGSVSAEKLRHFFATELSKRKAYRLPPYGSVTGLIGTGSTKLLTTEATRLTTELNNLGFTVGPEQHWPALKRLSLEIYSDKHLTKTQKSTLQQLLGPSWHLDVDVL